jgi:hypothetical protein
MFSFLTCIVQPARISLKSGCEGVSAINTIMSVMGINLKTLRPEPCVEGYSTPGGYSARAVHPIALAKVMQIARMMKEEFADGQSLSAIGGVETGNDAAEFILLGADTVQVSSNMVLMLVLCMFIFYLMLLLLHMFPIWQPMWLPLLWILKIIMCAARVQLMLNYILDFFRHHFCN